MRLNEKRTDKENSIEWLRDVGAPLMEELGIVSARSIYKWLDRPHQIEGNYYTVAEVAEILDVTEREVRRMCENDVILAVPDLLSLKKQSPWLIPKESLDEYLLVMRVVNCDLCKEIDIPLPQHRRHKKRKKKLLIADLESDDLESDDFLFGGACEVDEYWEDEYLDLAIDDINPDELDAELVAVF